MSIRYVIVWWLMGIVSLVIINILKKGDMQSLHDIMDKELGEPVFQEDFILRAVLLVLAESVVALGGPLIMIIYVIGRLRK